MSSRKLLTKSNHLLTKGYDVTAPAPLLEHSGQWFWTNEWTVCPHVYTWGSGAQSCLKEKSQMGGDTATPFSWGINNFQEVLNHHSIRTTKDKVKKSYIHHLIKNIISSKLEWFSRKNVLIERDPRFRTEFWYKESQQTVPEISQKRFLTSIQSYTKSKDVQEISFWLTVGHYLFLLFTNLSASDLRFLLAFVLEFWV